MSSVCPTKTPPGTLRETKETEKKQEKWAGRSGETESNNFLFILCKFLFFKNEIDP